MYGWYNVRNCGNDACGINTTYRVYLNPGYRWNGYVLPLFTFEEACRAASDIVASEPEYDIRFDAENDMFVSVYEDEDEDAEEFGTIDVDGMHLYAFGWCWGWYIEDED